MINKFPWKIDGATVAEARRKAKCQIIAWSTSSIHGLGVEDGLAKSGANPGPRTASRWIDSWHYGRKWVARSSTLVSVLGWYCGSKRAPRLSLANNFQEQALPWQVEHPVLVWTTEAVGRWFVASTLSTSHKCKLCPLKAPGATTIFDLIPRLPFDEQRPTHDFTIFRSLAFTSLLGSSSAPYPSCLIDSTVIGPAAFRTATPFSSGPPLF
ncbi:hypothetical protein VTG60DRAFT_958 [Thermothelomyces hinnuleus]